MNITIDPASPVPAYLQIVQVIRLAILGGRLKEGDQLPPIRELASLAKVNPNTVGRAYGDLEREGLIEGRVGSGSWIRPPGENRETLRRKLLTAAWNEFLAKAQALGFNQDEIHRLTGRNER